MNNINAIQYMVGKNKFFIGVVEAKDLISKYDIDTHSQSNLKGYQRVLGPLRSKKFSEYLSQFNGYFHQTVLLNIRKTSGFTFKTEDGTTGILEIHEKVWVVDGQHRVEGLRLFLEADSSFGDMLVPVLIMVGLSREDEAKQFLIVNKTQKGVKTDLQLKLLEGVIGKMPPNLLKIIGIKDPQEIINKKVAVSERLNNNKKSIWHNRIVLAGEKRKKTETINLTSMINSLDHVLDDTYIQTNYRTVNRLSDVLNQYWDAIKLLCPKACGKDAKTSVLLKTCGSYVMHRLFPKVLIMCGANPTVTKMKNILSRIDEMTDSEWSSEGSMAEGSSYSWFDGKYESFKDSIET